MLISERGTENSIKELTPEAQGPTEDDSKNESRKAWTMEMLMNSFDNSMNMTSEEESMSDNERMFLYAGSALESLDSIPYASDNGATKGDQRVQKHDDGRIGSDTIRV